MTPDSAIAVEKLLDGTLSAQERDALAQDALRDPDIIPTAVDAMEVNAAFRALHDRSADLHVMECIRRKLAGPSSSSRRQVRRHSALRKTARKTSRRVPLMLFLMSAMAAGITILIAVQSSSSASPEDRGCGFRLSRGDGASIRGLSGGVTPAQTGQILHDGDSLETGGVEAEVQGFDGTRLSIDPVSRVSFSGAFPTRITIDSGRIMADVTHQPGNRIARFVTPHAEISVVGTAFSIQVTSRESRLDMQHGEVRVTALAGGANLAVRGGESVKISMDGLIERLTGASTPVAMPPFAMPELASWTIGGNAESSIRHSMIREGAQEFLRMHYQFKASPQDNAYGYACGGFTRSDLSNYTGVEIRYRGEGTGLHCFVDLREVGLNDASEAFWATFPDDAPGWQTRRLRWSDFTRRTDWQPVGAGTDGLDLTRVIMLGVVFERPFVSANPGKPMQGDFDLAEMSLFRESDDRP